MIVGDKLGDGVHGIVFKAEDQSLPYFCAIKCHRSETDYLRERDIYLRLRENKVSDIRGCAVPQFIGFDDELFILEMTFVTRPFVLDFGGAFLDRPPEFSEEVLADWHAQKIEEFDERWPEVQAILRILETFGVFMIDVHPGNISWST